jgi:hypothetical protein
MRKYSADRSIEHGPSPLSYMNLILEICRRHDAISQLALPNGNIRVQQEAPRQSD